MRQIIIFLLVFLGAYFLFVSGVRADAPKPTCNPGCGAFGVKILGTGVSTTDCWYCLDKLCAIKNPFAPCGKVTYCAEDDLATYDYFPPTGGNTIGTCNPTTKKPVYLCLDSSDPNKPAKCDTAVGLISVKIPTSGVPPVVEFFLQYAMAISGGIILIMLIITGYTVLTSGGNPEKLQGAKENIVAIISGFLLIVFSQVLLHAVGVDIFGLPGF